MKQFKNVAEMREWARQYKPIDVNPEWYIYIKDKQLLEFGDWILFQHIMYERKSDKEHQAFASRPLFGLFVTWTVWDQALVLNFIEKNRAYMLHCAVNKEITHPEYADIFPFGCEDPTIETFQQWTENVHMLGVWKQKPSISDLRIAYKNML